MDTLYIFQAVVGRRQNKLRNASGLIGLSFFRHDYRIVKIAHIGKRTRSEHQFLYAKVQYILVPPHFHQVPSHYICSGGGTGMADCIFSITIAVHTAKQT